MRPDDRHTPVTFVTFFDKIQGGSDERVWGVKSHIFGICQKVFSGIKMKMVFCQN